MKKHCWGNLVSRFRALETFFAETFFCVQAAKKKQMFLNFSKNISLPHQTFLARTNGLGLGLGFRKHFTQCFRLNWTLDSAKK